MFQRSASGVVDHEIKRGGLFIERVEPSTVGVKGKMARPRSRRRREGLGIGKCSRRLVEFPNYCQIQSQITHNYEVACWIGLDHMGVRRVVAADGKATRRRVLSARWSHGARTRRACVGVVLDVRGIA